MPEVCRTARLALLCLTLLPLASAAQVVRDTNDPLDAFAVVDPRLRPSPSGSPFDSAAADLEPGVRAGWGDFLARAGGPWKGYVDRRTGLVESAEGAGIPWIPGAGNSLGEAEGGKAGKPDLARLEAIARAFLPRVAGPLGIDPATLKLAPGRSGLIGNHLWLVDFDVRLEGLTVEGARVVFRVNNGNLIQFGTENLPSPGAAVPPQQVGRKEALDVLARHLGGFTALDTFVDGGTERLLPLSLEEGFKTGEGRGLVRAWEIVFRRKGSIGTWRARVDAATGDILDFQDVNAYSQANGGVYPSSYIFANETALPMPFADLSTGGFANSAGQFPSGGSPSSTLSGQYVDIFDQCGSISQAAGGSGNIQFGTSGGTDCTTPGSGGAGNTHAARTQFYHLNRIKEAGRAWLPGNTWLTTQLPTVVNISATCNAYWNGNSVNFFKSGGGCGNTGEIAAISLHEYGHGLDSNDGAGFSLDGGTGEAYADVTAALVLRDSCVGPGFQGGNCGGYGDACTSCTGVRDIDWARHVSNTPHTVDNFYRPRCGFGGGGPCGGEVHCESYVASEAMWDFAARDLPNPGSAGAWGIAERLWYFSRPTATVAHTCNTSNIPWTSDGCTTGSWWRTMRAADDDDGNLANGTPHSCQLFAAFNRHGMACAADAGANVCFAGCTPPAVPTVGLTAGNHQVSLSWTSSGPGAAYDVFRSDAGCGGGFVKVASDVSGTAFTDTGLANGLAYSYQVVAHGPSFACSAPASACQSATPQLPPCPSPPPAPAAPTATTQGVERIQLSWTAVPGASEYLLLRSTSPGGPFVQFKTVSAPATSHLDTGLTQNTTYYYVMRVATAENCISTNSAAAWATTNQCQEITLYDNSFESGSGLSDWTVASLDSSSTEFWRGIQACTAHSGSKIFRFGGDTCGGYYADAVNIVARPMGSGGIAVPAGADLTRLSFWHRWNFESGYDGGTLRVSVDGNQYVSVPAAAIIGGSSYNGTLYGGCHPSGFYGTPTFTSFQNGFVETEVDLDQACDLASGTTGGCAGRSVRLDFAALTDCSVYSLGWFVDDVDVTTCAPHGCTGAPVIGTATTPADNQVSLTWSNGAPASTSFNVYRALGTCAAPGPFTKIATGVGASPYLDAPVSGSLTYAYRVSGLDASGVCESDKSACVQVVPTGPCNLPPSFAGLAAAGDAQVGTCALDLSWDPAVAYCGGPVTYDVFRSTDPTFVPAPANRIATGLTGTSLEDSGALDYGATYYYVVRAVDTATAIADTNTVRRSAIPTGPLVMTATLPDTFEAADGFDLEGWTNTGSSTPWTWSSARWQTPGHSWYAPGRAFAAESLLTSPPISVQAGSTLTFWHTYEFEACFDGGALEVSEDGGYKWASVPTFAFVAGGYTEYVYGYSNPIYGRPAWCHGTLGAMTQVQVSLALWQGKTIQVRWHSGADSSVASNGWYVDSVSFHDVVVDNGCTTEPPPSVDFYTLTPCRLVDTRAADAPALQPGELRTFQIAGACGVPATARALSVNMTAVSPVAAGEMILFRSNQTPPLASSISFKAGVNRANNGMISLSPSGEISVQANTPGTVHLVLDVNGYFD